MEPDTTQWAVVGDTSALPRVSFGRRSLLWWGTLAFVIIEGWALAVCAATYLYVRAAASHWPPAETPPPGLWMSTANVCLMLVSLVPMRWTDVAARRLDRHRARIGLALCCLFGFLFLAARLLEFVNLNTSWRDGPYGSAVWTTLGIHTSLIVLALALVMGATLILFRRRVPIRFLSDTADIALYWYFLVLVWLPLYAMIYVFPRFG
jgi:heme/copper-type cytochrome/quinol oxidase subunit 3